MPFGLNGNGRLCDEVRFHFFAHADFNFGREFIQILAVASDEYQKFGIWMHMRLVGLGSEPIGRLFHVIYLEIMLTSGCSTIGPPKPKPPA
jgi:hypothetical protein